MPDPVMDFLWPATRAAFKLPEKPGYSEPCNRCGLYCLMEQCQLSELLFGPRPICPAISFGNGQSACDLMVAPAKQVPDEIAEDVRDLATLMLGASQGCDATTGAAENDFADTLPDFPPEPTPAEHDRVAALIAKLRPAIVMMRIQAAR